MKPENSAATIVSAATACVLSGTEQKNDKQLKLTLEAGPSGRTVVLHCQGRIIFRSQACALSSIVAEVLPSARRMVVDLAGVESIDSSGLGELVLIHMWAEAAGYALKFAGPRNSVRHLFEITNLASVFDVYGSVPEAMSAMVQDEAYPA
jgi:anti-sigma B factor antagonist